MSRFYAEGPTVMKNRTLTTRLRDRAARKTGRLLVLTGARQTGKTTLVKAAFPDVPYLSLEDPLGARSA